MRSPNRSGSIALHVGAVLAVLLPAAANGFVPLHRQPDPIGAPRWSAAAHPEVESAGLQGGISVAVEAGFAEAVVLAVTGTAESQDIAELEAAVLAAFDAWTSPVLFFEVEFDGPAERGTGAGAEIDLFAVPDSDPAFANNDYFGVAFWRSVELADRKLTNGSVLAGPAIVGADIFINLDRVALVAPIFTREQQPAAIRRLLIHEIGHAIGLHHPNEFPAANLDTDDDPLNEMVIDPLDPFADLVQSPNVDADAILSNLPPGGIPALLFTVLRNDDRGGRDVLYPALGEPQSTPTATSIASPATHTPVTPVPTATPTSPLPTPSPPAVACLGDCNGDGAVRIAELVLGVRIALGDADIDACRAFDAAGNGRVGITDLVRAVGHAIDGCPTFSALRARLLIAEHSIGCE